MGGLLERELISFFHSKGGGGLWERGAYLRGGLNREIMVARCEMGVFYDNKNLQRQIVVEGCTCLLNF